MKDRFTQFDLLPHPPRPHGFAAVKDWGRRFGAAYRALPQRRALRRAVGYTLRQIAGGLYYWFWRFWVSCSPWFRRRLRRLRHWLPRTKFVLGIVDWAHRFRKATLELPQHRFVVRVHRRFNAHPGERWMFYMILLVLIELPVCLNNQLSDRSEYIYLLVDEMGPTVSVGYPTEAYESDTITVSTDSATQDAQFILHKGQDITIRYGKEHITVECRRETVANLLRRMDITPAKNEMIAVNISGKTPLIHISDELRYERSEQTFSSYNTRTFSNYLLPKGEFHVVQEGQPGCITDTYEDVYRMGEIVETHLVSRSDDSAVTQIVEYGHLTTEMDQDVRAVKDHPFLTGEGGYLVFENGDSMLYTKKVINNATAYYGGVKTATGHATGVGVMAVDPTVYPYGTSMYVGSVSGGSYYGIATAYDCGGAVKGMVIDLWYPSYAACCVWGRRNVTCYILQATRVT